MIRLTLLIFFVVSALVIRAQSTITISTLDTNDYNISAGTTLEITPAGYLTGNLSIHGFVKNYGTINNASISLYAGALHNFSTGIISSSQVWLARGFHNSGCFNADTIKCGGTSQIFNYAGGNINCYRLAIMWGLGVIKNSGGINVTEDLSLVGRIENNQRIDVGGSFRIHPGGKLFNTCTITVGGDFINEGTVTGDTSGVPGLWTVNGITSNAGVFCDSSYCDMCDQGNPPGGFDNPGGTIGTAAFVTYCTSLGCVGSSAVQCSVPPPPPQAGEIPVEIFPNPAHSTATLYFSLETAGTIQITLWDMLGRNVMQAAQNGVQGYNTIEINVQEVPSGMYILRVQVGKETFEKKIIVSNREE